MDYLVAVREIMLTVEDTLSEYLFQFNNLSKSSQYHLKEELQRPNDYLFETYVYPHIFYIDEYGNQEWDYKYRKGIDDSDKSSHSPRYR